MTELEILLVEDNAWDAKMTLTAFARSGQPTVVRHMADGEAAMQHLQSLAPEDVPDLILLDLHLPGKSGLEILAEVKKDPVLRAVPVIVLTASRADRDLVQAYDLHANACLRKPEDPREYEEIVAAIRDFWVTKAHLPGAA